MESLPAALPLFWTEILLLLPTMAVTMATVAVTVATVAVTVATMAVTMPAVAVTVMMITITFLTTRNWNEVFRIRIRITGQA